MTSNGTTIDLSGFTEKELETIHQALLDYAAKSKRLRVETQNTPHFEEWDKAWGIALDLLNDYF